MRVYNVPVGVLAPLASLLALQPAHLQAQTVNSVVWTSSTCRAADGPAVEAGLLSGLLGIVLGPLIEAGVKGLGEAIAKAGAPSDIHSTGAVDTHLYKVGMPLKAEFELRKPGEKVEPRSVPANPKLLFARSCVVAAVGPRASLSEGKDATPESLAAAFQAEDVPPLAADGGLRVVDRLSGTLDKGRMAVLVASPELARDGSAFRLVPQYVSVGQSFDRKEKQRRVSFTLSISPPGALADGTATAVRTISFKNLTGPRSWSSAEARLSATSWIPMPPVSDGVRTRISAATQRVSEAYALREALDGGLQDPERRKAQADLDRLVKLLEDDRKYLKEVAPMTIRVDTHQIRPGSQFLVKLGNFLSGNAGKIATPVADALNPEKRAASAEADTQKVEALRIVAVTESANLVKARTAGDKPAEQISQIKLGAACRQIAAAGFSEAACLLAP